MNELWGIYYKTIRVKWKQNEKGALREKPEQNSLICNSINFSDHHDVLQNQAMKNMQANSLKTPRHDRLQNQVMKNMLANKLTSKKLLIPIESL